MDAEVFKEMDKLMKYNKASYLVEQSSFGNINDHLNFPMDISHAERIRLMRKVLLYLEVYVGKCFHRSLSSFYTIEYPFFLTFHFIISLFIAMASSSCHPMK